MKTTFKKIALIFGLVALVAAVLAVVTSAEKTDFAATEYSDITPANGWVHIGSKSAAADDDGKDIELYYIKEAEAYLNRKTKTLVVLGKGSLTGSYGDWNVSDTKNTPGAKYYLIWWAASNSDQVEHIEFRQCGPFNNGAFILQMYKHAKTVKLATTANGTYGSKQGTGLFVGMTSLTTVGHGTFDKDGQFTPVTYKENVVDMTGFTYLRPAGGEGDSKAVMYQGGMFYNCASITEVVFPKSMTYNSTYTPAVEQNGSWVKGTTAIKAAEDEFGGQYAGIFAKVMFGGDESLSKITVPEGVAVTMFEIGALSNCPVLRCITVKGSISPNVKVAGDSFNGIMDGCIIQCANAADIEILNKALTAAGITNVKAVDMNTQPTPAPVVTKIPMAPKWEAFDAKGATAYGEMVGTYTENYWAYYADTKTLTFTAKVDKTYNEVGTIDLCTDGIGWTQYKTEIEHVVIGPRIQKLTAAAFSGMSNLKDIGMTSDIKQASGAFTGCTSLTTIWVRDMERVEGQAMLAGAKTNFKLSFADTVVSTIHMGSSPIALLGNITIGAKTSTLIFDIPPQDVIDYCKENYLNVKNSGGQVFGEWYVEVPEGLPFCGNAAVFDFDEETGTLYILGKGAIGDIANYWGGGSKNQYWFSVKNKIKHVKIGEYITAIGKYSFTGCENLETVQLPKTDGFIILNAAFEDCYNLKSIYVEGDQPIEGTYDLSLIHKLESYSFADNYCVANVIINENVDKIGESVFDNSMNVQNIYGVPGSYSEEYAESMEFAFYDAATNTPQPITCTAPEEPADTRVDTTPETEPETAPETVLDTTPDTAPETQPADNGADNVEDEGDGAGLLPVIIVVAVVVLVAAAAAVLFIVKKKSKKN